MQRGGRQRAPREGIEIVVAEELEDRTMEVIRSRAGNDVDHAAGEAAVFRTVAVGHHAEFFHRVRVRGDVAGVTQAGHIRAAVEEIVDRPRAAVDAAIDHGALLRKAEHDAIAARRDARGQCEESIDVASDDGQRGEFGMLHRPSHLGVFGVHQGDGSGHVHDIGLAANVERGIGALNHVYLQGDSFLQELLEALCRNFQRVVADRQEVETIFALGIGLAGARLVGPYIGGNHAGAGNYSAGLIGDGAIKSGGSLGCHRGDPEETNGGNEETVLLRHANLPALPGAEFQNSGP